MENNKINGGLKMEKDYYIYNERIYAWATEDNFYSMMDITDRVDKYKSFHKNLNLESIIEIVKKQK